MTDYEILGVEPTASEQQLRDAYVFLVSKFHPDANPGREDKAAEHFRKVDEAYNRIRNGPRPTKNAPLDDVLRAEAPPEAPRPVPASPPAAEPASPTMNEFIDEMVENYEPDKGAAIG